jgi:hypothetical protein
LIVPRYRRRCNQDSDASLARVSQASRNACGWPGRIASVGRAVIVIAILLAVAGCGPSNAAPSSSAVDFGGITADLAAAGIRVTNVVSGDAACADPALIPTAISFQASGLDQATPVSAHLYIFGSQASYDRLRQSVDACAGAFVRDPQGLVSIDASPFVLVGQGPWAPTFVAAIRGALGKAASGS